MAAGVDSFLDKDNIVQDFPTFDESSLVFWDDPGKNSFQPGSNDLCYKLVASVAQRDGLESLEAGGSFFFWDQG